MEADSIKRIAEEAFRMPVSTILPLPASGSNRRYYRLTFDNSTTILAAENNEVRENRAFIEFSKHFRQHGLPVPEILHEHPDGTLYFQSDLGNTTLYDFISANRDQAQQILHYYQSAADALLQFQFCPPPDYRLCFPRDSFDRTSMMWDLNYFKYYFLKLANIPFDEQKLEHDYIAFCDALSGVPSDFFMYRDFQSRNIMVNGSDLAFVDYQGGRRGALQYDLASLLYDAKANLSDDFRTKIFNYYCEKLQAQHPELIEEFKEYFYHFVLLRIMQAFGAYGYRGYYEKKSHFLQSVPLAAANLNKLLQIVPFGHHFPELWQVWNHIAERFDNTETEIQSGILQVDISSFSYKKGYPSGDPEHGGGFIFDCRALPNPGREERFKMVNGKDATVIEWLSEKEEVAYFLDACADLVCLSVDNYLERKFNRLTVAFGCTGGQHRSVYCAEHLARDLQNRYGHDIQISLSHREQS